MNVLTNNNNSNNVAAPPAKKAKKAVAHKCVEEIRPVPGESYEADKAKHRENLKNKTTTRVTIVTDANGRETSLTCMFRADGFARQYRVPAQVRCKDGANCPLRRGTWRPKTHRIEAQRVPHLPATLQTQKDNADYLTVDHFCHDEGGECVNPEHIDFTTLEVNKGRNGCPGPLAGCMHGRICKPCLIPGQYSGNRQAEE